jgi:hypothetical protein
VVAEENGKWVAQRICEFYYVAAVLSAALAVASSQALPLE